MNFSKFFLPNGLKVLVVPMESLPSATVRFWVKVGSRWEEKRIGGISHFFEHMAFKGSKKRPSAKEISEAIDAIGGEFNASTGKEDTNFYVKVRSEKLDVAFDVLSDMVFHPILNDAEIEREKGVILEEMAMYEDTPISKINDVFENVIFANSNLAPDIIGSKESVTGLSRNDFINFRNKHYASDNMLLVVSGGVNEAEIKRLAIKYFGNYKGETPSKYEYRQRPKPKERIKLVYKNIEQAHICFGFCAEGRDYEGRFAQAILATILGGGMSSRLFIEIRERRGLAYSVRTGTERYVDCGYIATYMGVDPKKAPEAQRVLREEHFLLKTQKKSISVKEITKAKEFLKGHLALAIEDSKEVNGFFAEQEIFLGKILTPEEIFKKVDKVTIDDVYSEAEKLFNNDSYMAIIGPYKDKDHSNFEKLIR